jgi:hypothetical protein
MSHGRTRGFLFGGMMNLHNSLFHSEHIWLAHMDLENDAPIEARWSHDAVYQPARRMGRDND